MSDDCAVPSPSDCPPVRSHVVWAFAAVWIVAVVAGLSVLWAWENTPGAAGDAPAQWPAESGLSRAADLLYHYWLVQRAELDAESQLRWVKPARRLSVAAVPAGSIH